MDIKIYTSLPTEAREIRQTVFVDEQGFNEEFDTIDGNAVHFVLFEDGRAVATARAYTDDGVEYHLGRIAVRKEYRGRHYGEAVMAAAEAHIASLGCRRVVLSSQCRAQGFYEKVGYTAYGDTYLDEHCPHIMMQKTLAE